MHPSLFPVEAQLLAESIHEKYAPNDPLEEILVDEMVWASVRKQLLLAEPAAFDLEDDPEWQKKYDSVCRHFHRALNAFLRLRRISSSRAKDSQTTTSPSAATPAVSTSPAAPVISPVPARKSASPAAALSRSELLAQHAASMEPSPPAPSTPPAPSSKRPEPPATTTSPPLARAG